MQQGQLPIVSAGFAVVSFLSCALAVYIGRTAREINAGERLGISVSICVACLSLFASLLGLMSRSGMACAHVASLCN